MNDNQKPEPISTTSPDDTEPDWNLLEEEVSTETPSHEGEAGPDHSGLLSPDDFYQCVKAMFELPNVFLPTPIKSLPIADGEEQQARAATDALYGIALKSPWLRFLLQPGAEWLQPIIAIGTFALGKIAVVRLELSARNAPRVPGVASAANDNGANDNTAAQAGLGPFANERPA